MQLYLEIGLLITIIGLNGLASYSWILIFLFLAATRTTLIPGTLPTLNLPIKSHPSSR